MMRTRFAPSPTGPLHLGHAYAAIFAHDLARRHDGEFLLRIEDIDQTRARPEWEQAIYDDLAWLGLSWESPVLRQSENMAAYAAALDVLWSRDLLYPCTCTRRDIADALSAPQEGVPLAGPDGPVYPGTCRAKDASRPRHRENRPTDRHLRLDMAKSAARACARNDTPDGLPERVVTFLETGSGPHGEHGTIRTSADALQTTIGDVVLSRREFGTSYHLAVVIDDAAQGVTHVTRGNDLFAATPIHVVLQKLLDLPTPVYCHHALVRDDHGKRLAKRDDARAISAYRRDGATPGDIRRLVGLG